MIGPTKKQMRLLTMMCMIGTMATAARNDDAIREIPLNIAEIPISIQSIAHEERAYSVTLSKGSIITFRKSDLEQKRNIDAAVASFIQREGRPSVWLISPDGNYHALVQHLPDYRYLLSVVAAIDGSILLRQAIAVPGIQWVNNDTIAVTIRDAGADSIGVYELRIRSGEMSAVDSGRGSIVLLDVSSEHTFMVGDGEAVAPTLSSVFLLDKRFSPPKRKLSSSAFAGVIEYGGDLSDDSSRFAIGGECGIVIGRVGTEFVHQIPCEAGWVDSDPVILGGDGSIDVAFLRRKNGVDDAIRLIIAHVNLR